MQEILVKQKKCINNISKYTEQTHEFNHNTTFKDIINQSDLDYIMIYVNNKVEGEKYYINVFDYIISDKCIKWNPKITDTKIVDYINTFETNEIEIHIDQIGIGADFGGTVKLTIDCIIEFIKLLYNNKEYLEFAFLTYELFKEIGNYIKKTKKQKNIIIGDHFYFYSILINDNWKLKKFKAMYKLSTKSARTLLLLLGYKYNKSKRIYHISNKQRKKVIDLYHKFNKYE